MPEWLRAEIEDTVQDTRFTIETIQPLNKKNDRATRRDISMLMGSAWEFPKIGDPNIVL